MSDESLKSRAVPIRSLVHVGADQGAVQQALAAGADALFFDLEEPYLHYGPREKAVARSMVSDYLSDATAGSGPLSFVRVHSPWTGETIQDLRAAIHPSLTGVILPKTAGPRDVIALDGILGCVELELGRQVGSTQILPFLETAQSIRLAYEIAIASPRVTYMGGMVSRFGDVHRAIGYRWTAQGAESLYLRAKVLMDARAAGIKFPISGAWGGDPLDHDGLRSWGESLRDLGYFGMLVGASGVEVAHEVFTPSAEDVAYWRGLVEQGRVLQDGHAHDAHDAQVDSGQSETPPEVHMSYVHSAHANLDWARRLGCG